MSRMNILRALLLAACASTAVTTRVSAQEHVRVVRDRTIVWQAGFFVPAAVVNAGTTLDVVGRQGNWYEVVIPRSGTTSARTGFVAVSSVAPADSASPQPPPDLPRSAAPPRTVEEPTPARREPEVQRRSGEPAGAQRRPPQQIRRSSHLRAFGQAAYGQFAAADAFRAVLGTSRGAWFGGGAEFRTGSGWFVQGSVERFRRTGERVFISDGTVFKLGIDDTVTVVPLVASAGKRFETRSVTPYVGGGVGQFRLTEHADFTDASEDVHENHVGYVGFGGVEFGATSFVRPAIEVQYTAVPDALGDGAAAIFDEKDLGGLQIRVRLLFGR